MWKAFFECKLNSKLEGNQIWSGNCRALVQLVWRCICKLPRFASCRQECAFYRLIRYVIYSTVSQRTFTRVSQDLKLYLLLPLFHLLMLPACGQLSWAEWISLKGCRFIYCTWSFWNFRILMLTYTFRTCCVIWHCVWLQPTKCIDSIG